MENQQKLVAAIQQLQSNVQGLNERITRIEKLIKKKQSGGQVSEAALRAQLDVQRLLNNGNWKHAAEAAIAYFIHGTKCEVAATRKTATWQQVEAAYKRIQRQHQR